MTPRHRKGWRRAYAAALAVVAWLLGAAALVWPLAAAAADDLFTVASVTVDTTADNAQLAQERALALGQRRALEQMFAKLTLDVDHPRLPDAGADLLTRLVRGYEVVNERRSGQRYIAELAVRFDPDGVRQALRAAGIPYAETLSPPQLVLPVMVDGAGARLWAEPNPWLAAWRELAWRNRLIELVVPFGELADLAEVSADQALAGAAVPLATIARRYGAAAALVAVARSGPDGLAVVVERHGAGAAEVVYRERHPPVAADDAGAAFRQAAAAVAGALERAWKRDNLLDFRVSGALAVTAALSGFDDWLRLRRSLEALSQIARVDIEALSTREARLTLHHFGPRDRLAEALAARRITLREDPSGRWRVEVVAGAAPVPAAVPDERTAASPPLPAAPAAPAAPARPAPGAPEPGEPEPDVPFDYLLVE